MNPSLKWTLAACMWGTTACTRRESIPTAAPSLSIAASPHVPTKALDGFSSDLPKSVDLHTHGLSTIVCLK